MSDSNGNVYATLLERIETAAEDKSGLRILPGLKTQVRRSNLPDEEKIELEDKIEEITSQLYEIDSNPDEEFPSVDFDAVITNVITPSFQTLNPLNLPYPLFLKDIILPRFFPMKEQELQHPVMACVCLINSAYIPGVSKRNSNEAELPKVYLLGRPQSGKTQFGKFIGLHYFKGRHAMILGDTSGKEARNIIDRTCCPKDDDKLVPANIFFDNFEPEYLGNQWNVIRERFIAVERSQSTSAVATVNKTESVKFRSWALFTLSATKPIDVVARSSEELARRIVPLLFEPNFEVDSLGNYDFSELPNIYKSLWNKQFTEKIFLPNLGQLLSIKNVPGDFPNNKLGRSKVLIATGVSFGIWQSIEEALDHLGEYWKFIESNQQSTSNALMLVVDEYLKGLSAYPIKSPFGGSLTISFKYKVALKDLVREISERLCRAKGEKLERELTDLMQTRGYYLDTVGGDIYYIKVED